jgi:hypothetical protein
VAREPLMIDLTDLVSRGSATRRIRFCGEMVSVASLLPMGEWHESPVRCRRRPNRRPCSGKLRLLREEPDDFIRWECPVCADRGRISNWHETRWDREPALRSGQVVSLLQVRAQRDGQRLSRRPTRAYELLVELIGGPLDLDEIVARRIRIGGDKTLHELHVLVRRAFDREEDEPYEFMFGAPYEIDARRFTGGLVAAPDDPEDAWETQLISLDTLELSEGQVFGYLFDFGEEWVHRVSVLSVSKETSYAVHARVVERMGSSPPQYPDIDELWDDDPLWSDVDDDFPLTGLYGPYLAEEPPDAELWQAMEDLERLLLVAEAHAQLAAESGHPEVRAMPLHAVIHYLAENAVARGDSDVVETMQQLQNKGSTRHQAIHRVGEAMVRELLREPVLESLDPTGENAEKYSGE